MEDFLTPRKVLAAMAAGPGKDVKDASRIIGELEHMDTDKAFSEEVKSFLKDVKDATPEELDELKEIFPGSPEGTTPENLDEYLATGAALNAIAGAWLDEKQREPKEIIIPVPDYDPELDPNSPQFNQERYLQETKITPEDLARMKKTLAELKDSLNHSVKNLVTMVDAGKVNEILQSALADMIQSATQATELSTRLTSSDFLLKVYETTLATIAGLPPEEQAQILEEEPEPAEDENQLSLFEEQPAAPVKKKRKTKLETLIEQGVIETILQNNSTNALTKFTEKDVKIDPIQGTATLKRGDFILQIPDYLQLKGLKTSTWQLLDSLIIKLTADPRKSKTTLITLDEYMQRRGLKDRKQAKESAIADMEILRTAGITLEERKGKSRVSYRFVNLAQSGSVEKNGNIIITWTDDVHRDLINAPVMPYPRQIQEVNNRLFPNAYYMGRKAAELKNMNALHNNAGDVIAVKTLLENAPYIPSYEEVAATDRMYTRRIIEPFERDLTALQGAFSWEYCHENGKPLTDKELEAFSYETFIACLVKFTWKDYPDQTKRREALEAKIAEAKAKQEAQQKRKRGRPPKEKKDA